MKSIIIGSLNPVKEAVVRNVFAEVFPNEEFTFQTFRASSDVSDQPMGIEETRLGALNRTNHCRIEFPDADYYIGLEGGIEVIDTEYWVSAWMCVQNKAGKHGYGRAGSFCLPNSVSELIKSGKELTQATDEIFNAKNSGYKQGIIGFLTNEKLNRSQYYKNALVYALIPFIHTDLY